MLRRKLDDLELGTEVILPWTGQLDRLVSKGIGTAALASRPERISPFTEVWIPGITIQVNHLAVCEEYADEEGGFPRFWRVGKGTLFEPPARLAKLKRGKKLLEYRAWLTARLSAGHADTLWAVSKMEFDAEYRECRLWCDCEEYENECHAQALRKVLLERIVWKIITGEE